MSDLADFRRAKDDFMGRDHQSPLTDDQQRAFTGLTYFVEDPSLKFEPEVQEFENPEVVEMQTSTGQAASYLRWGKIAFSVEGEPAELTLYKDLDGEEVFLPFADATSGEETYGAGRYLDTHPLPGGQILVDFNHAYNPYCAYNEQWSCPLTPFENRLQVPIRAGEKVFK